ncbi:small subunit ribosomal protein S17 [Microdochium nivale]|nr:small subunit ribosomal protein S17 [Microdochium nivale]
MATTHLASARKMVMELLPTVPKEFHGIVVSAGLMDKTVKVQLGGQRWEKRIKKHFKQPRFALVHDPRNSVRQGDIISIQTSWRESQHVRHVVKHILAPYGEAIDARPAVPSLEELIEEKVTKRAAKNERRELHKEEKALADAEKRKAVLEARQAKLARSPVGRKLQQQQEQTEDEAGFATAEAESARAEKVV